MPFGIGHHGHRVGHLVLAGSRHALDRIGFGHREGDHNLVGHPLLLHLAEPRCGRDLVAGLGQRLELPQRLEVDRVGNRTAGDEQTVHLLEVVLQTVVVARKHARGERHLEHVAFEFDLVADFEAAGAVEHLHIGVVAHDLDDLGHHSGISDVHVTDFVLAHGSVGLDNHDIGDDTVYTSCSFHRMIVFTYLSTPCRPARPAAG